MLIAEKYEIPDECPHNCEFRSEIAWLGQSAMCVRCPIFNCSPMDEEGLRMLEPEDFREDWAKAWAEYFQSL